MANSLASLSGRVTTEVTQQQPDPEGRKDRRVFMYRPSSEHENGVEAFCFDSPEDIPEDEGWVDSPAKCKPEEKPAAKAMPMTRAERAHQRRQSADLE